MSSRKRLLLLAVLLMLSVCAAIWVSNVHDDAPEVVTPVADKTAARREEAKIGPQAEGRTVLPLDKLQRVSMDVGEFNPFGAKSWYVPPPAPPPAQLPPAQPTAPALPFTYAGKLQEEGGRWVVYLTQGEQFYAVSKGETFDNVYRFDGIENGHLVIQYLPLSIKQLLPIGTES